MSGQYGCIHYDGKGLTGLCGACAADLRARLAAAESDATRARAARLLATGRADQSLARLAAAEARVSVLEGALRDCISALNWLPSDEGPVRRRAAEAVASARAALAGEGDK